ncbi:Imm26 family immunity protein [Pseudoxanthomonas sp. JBR18]|uniref:Imm26 family immunity protein n=1 Tax=Pseudoxanthomonas sp. JBR18 TaxID=2969308 RepID=UPI002305C42D|nr:Imm26 family immunity protein [Pseudoxanthomonas sp. JBR18]WCE05979.1 Imm26 family immunity protein [Pseudoxanthomonas sp. JBR18]
MAAREGDIFTIPLEDGRKALCRVLFASSYFKDVVLIGCYGVRSDDLSTSEQASTGPKAMVYTGWSKAWTIIGHEPMASHEGTLSRRIVAGDVWEGDKLMGKATEAELASLPKMQVHGHRILVRHLAKYV